MPWTRLCAGILSLALTAGCVSDPEPVSPDRPGRFSVDELYNLGMDYFQGGKFDLAERQFAHVLEKDPNHADGNLAMANTYYYLAKLYRAKGEKKRAIDYLNGSVQRFQRSMKLKPTSPEPYLGLAIVYLEDPAFYPNAVENLNKALAMDPDNREKNLRAHFYLGSACGLTGDLAKSAHHYETYLDMFPFAPDRPDVEDILEDNYKRRGLRYVRKPPPTMGAPPQQPGEGENAPDPTAGEPPAGTSPKTSATPEPAARPSGRR